MTTSVDLLSALRAQNPPEPQPAPQPSITVVNGPHIRHLIREQLLEVEAQALIQIGFGDPQGA